LSDCVKNIIDNSLKIEHLYVSFNIDKLLETNNFLAVYENVPVLPQTTQGMYEMLVYLLFYNDNTPLVAPIIGYPHYINSLLLLNIAEIIRKLSILTFMYYYYVSVKTNLESTALSQSTINASLALIMGSYYNDLITNVFPPSGANPNIKTINNNTALIKNYGYTLSYCIKPIVNLSPITNTQLYVYKYATYTFPSNLSINVSYKSFEVTGYDGNSNIPSYPPNVAVTNANPAKLLTNSILSQAGLNISVITYNPIIRLSDVVANDLLDYSDSDTAIYINQQLQKISKVVTENNSLTDQVLNNPGILIDALNIRSFATVSDDAPEHNEYVLNGTVTLDSNNNKTSNKISLKQYLQLLPDKSSDKNISALIDTAINVSPDYKYIRSILNTYYKMTGITPILNKTKLIKSPSNINFYKKNVNTLKFI
jgi:hypothetical protein